MNRGLLIIALLFVAGCCGTPLAETPYQKWSREQDEKPPMSSLQKEWIMRASPNYKSDVPIPTSPEGKACANTCMQQRLAKQQIVLLEYQNCVISSGRYAYKRDMCLNEKELNTRIINREYNECLESCNGK